MWRKAIIAVGCVAAAPASAESAGVAHVSCKGEPNEIRVAISNVEKDAGQITIELFRNDPDGFLNKGGREFRVRYAAHAPSTQICVTAPAPGRWALVAYHDINANKKFDKNAFGLPAEPFGVSGNPKFRLAPPQLGEALFDVVETGVDVEIRLKH